jgi:DNA-binding NarL/FixJ family response regulator
MTLRCVIVDDNPAVLRAAAELLEAQGVAVVGVATTSGGAVSLLEGLQPDVMLVDIDLGAESGFELARRLSQRVDAARMPVILTSTHDEADYANLIAASPAIGFLPKSDLSATAIRRLLAQSRDDGRY